MISLNPVIAPINTDQLYALLTMVADPAKHKALLDALVARVSGE